MADVASSSEEAVATFEGIKILTPRPGDPPKLRPFSLSLSLSLFQALTIEFLSP